MTPEEKRLCEEWVTSPGRKWQTLNRSQWKYQFREKTLVRYVEEAKMDEDIVPLLLEYLSSDDCKATLQLYGQAVAGDWTPIRAWYELSNKAVGNVRSVRLYHAIAIQPANGADGPYLFEDGCVYRVGWTYYWKRAAVPAPPESTSGISYRIVNLQRDPETGLFNYAVEKRERVRQDIEEYLVSKTQFESVSEESHFGVRGDLSVGGREASVSSGETVTRKVSKNADCTHDVHNTIKRSRPVRDAVVTQRMTLNGLTTQRTHRNQPEPAAAPTEIGKSIVNRKTDDGLYDVTETSEGETPAGKTGESCSRDAFTHHHAETRNEAEPQKVETEFTPGKIVRKTSTLTGVGTANNSTDTTTAVPQENSYTYTREDGAVVHVIKYRNKPNIPEYPNGAAGLTVNDGINSFQFHDGTITYLTNAPYKSTAMDLKFIKHGASQTFYEIAYDRRTRRMKHRLWTVQLHHIRGDAYTDYVADWMSADMTRTTAGVMCTQLVSRYKDSDGNDVAEWKWVGLVEPPAAWVVCLAGCKHGKRVFSQDDFRRAARALLAGGGESGADADRLQASMVAAIRDLPLAMSAAMQGMSIEEKRDEIARLEEARRGAGDGR